MDTLFYSLTASYLWKYSFFLISSGVQFAESPTIDFFFFLPQLIRALETACWYVCSLSYLHWKMAHIFGMSLKAFLDRINNII